MNQPSLPNLFQACAYRYAKEPFLYAQSSESDWFSKTWDEIALAVHRMGSGLLSESIAPGDSVGIWAQNSIPWVILDLAALSIGACPLAIPVSTSQLELKEWVQKHNIKLLVVDSWNEWKQIRSWKKSSPQLNTVVVLNEPHETERIEKDAIGFDELMQNEMAQSPQSFFERLAAISPEDPALFLAPGHCLSHQELANEILEMAKHLPLRSGDLHLSQISLSNPLERLGLYSLITLGGRIAYPSSPSTAFHHMKSLEPSLTIALTDDLQKLKDDLESTVQDRNFLARHLFKRFTSSPATQGLSRKLKNKLVLSSTRQHLGKNFRLIICEQSRLSGEELFFFENLGVSIERKETPSPPLT